MSDFIIKAKINKENIYDLNLHVYYSEKRLEDDLRDILEREMKR